MSFFNKLLKSPNQKEEKFNSLYDSLKTKFSDANHEELLKISCVCALMGRIALSDNNIDEAEKEAIKSSMVKWFDQHIENTNLVCDLLVDYVQEFGMMETHLITEELRRLYSKDELYSLVQTLFQIASSDGSVDFDETEDLRMLTTALGLSHQHFIAARASVLEYLAVLKN